jgi:hypothetical protein
MVVDDLRSRFAARFGEALAVSLEEAVDAHVAKLAFVVERGSSPFRFTLVWAVGLECLSRAQFREEHGVTAAWSDLCIWIRQHADLASFDGTFDWAGRAIGQFDDILGASDDVDLDRGRVAANAWVLATTSSVARS